MNRATHLRRFKKQSGFSLIEALIVLVIAGVVLFFVLRNQTTAENTQATTTVVSQLQTLAVKVKEVFKFNNYNGLTSASMVESRAAPPEMISGTTLRHELQGTVTLAAANCSGGTNNCFTMAVANIPGTSCASLVSTMQGDMFAVTVGSTVVKNASTAYAQATANTACNADSVTVTFTKS